MLGELGGTLFAVMGIISDCRLELDIPTDSNRGCCVGVMALSCRVLTVAVLAGAGITVDAEDGSAG